MDFGFVKRPILNKIVLSVLAYEKVLSPEIETRITKLGLPLG